MLQCHRHAKQAYYYKQRRYDSCRHQCSAGSSASSSKIDAVEVTLKEDMTIEEMVDDLGLRPALLIRWREKYLTTKEHVVPGTCNPEDAEMERIRQPERQLRLVTEERVILKNACAVFMKTPWKQNHQRSSACVSGKDHVPSARCLGEQLR